MRGAWFRILQQSAAVAWGPLEARGPWHSAIVPPTKDGPDCKAGIAHWQRESQLYINISTNLKSVCTVYTLNT